MNVLSLFDGMSCGRIALERAGIPVDRYYSSEIDKWAIKIADKNWPEDTPYRMGDVTRWKEWDIDWSSIDLVLAGSPCQSFSNSGSKKGFGDDRGQLFFVFVDILNHIKSVNPNVKFLLENVRMKQEHVDTISSHVGVEPVKIDSRLLSALSRPRLYWSNFIWQDIQYAADMTDCDMCGEPFCEHHQEHYAECPCIGPNEDEGIVFSGDKAFRIPTDKHKRLRDVLEDSREDMPWLSDKAVQRLANISERASAKGYGWGECIIKEDDVFLNLDASFYKGPDGKRGTILQDGKLRMPTPLECERLQTLPDGYTEGASNTQRYKMIGNGWTIEVISYLLKHL
jgi:DNA (cytosine-5)-methyltransferase 3A